MGGLGEFEKFRSQPGDLSALAKRPRASRRRAGGWFVRGPIPGEWITRAAKVSFRALRAGLALWYLAGVKKTRTVKPGSDAWARFGLSSRAGGRGLGALEAAGLVSVDRHPGRCPVVTINDCEAGP